MATDKWSRTFHVSLRVVPVLACVAGAAMPLQSQAPSNTRAGTVTRITVHGRALEGNLSGESPDRRVTIYVPPSYAAERARRYPVIYLLHGYSGTDETWTGRIANVPEIADRVFGSGAAREMIVVMPDGNSIYRGSMYSSSVTSGNWESYIADDLVAYVDTHYRTLANRTSRGLAGHSMGGYGTMRIGMKRPDVFASIYSLSACCLDATLNPNVERLAAAEAIRTREDVAAAGRGRGFGPLVWLAEAAAWSPNPRNPPFYFDLPTKDGKLRPEIVAKWVANAPLAMLDQHVDHLKQLHAIAADVGDADTLRAPNEALDRLLTQYDIRHVFEVYEGDHVNHIAQRVEQKVLPFFSQQLASGQGQTSR
jgi:enterochelin esterase-like enzyme